MSSPPFDGAYAGARVLVTGHTGFKGTWLAAWLAELGAEVHGLALPPATEPSLFALADLAETLEHREADVRDAEAVAEVVAAVRPRAVFHLAAQSLVRESYADPLGTFGTNALGTAHVLEAVRRLGEPCAVVVVTTDKCYENREWLHGYREVDPLGGHDPYSASKAAAELVTQSYRRSFFPPAELAEHGVAVASARAGNVIGPGDWAQDRILTDCVAALAAGRAIGVRNPAAVRPWQHVLEALSGYLALGAELCARAPARAAGAAEAWNFGPDAGSCRSVRELVEALIEAWEGGAWEDVSDGAAPHEARLLWLSTEKAAFRLGWRPAWGFAETVARTARGYRALFEARDDPGAVRALLRAEIAAYTQDAAARGRGRAPGAPGAPGTSGERGA